MIEGDFQYELNDNGDVTITKYRGKGGDVILPDKLGWTFVAAIDLDAFYDCPNLHSITLPAGSSRLGTMRFIVDLIGRDE